MFSLFTNIRKQNLKGHVWLVQCTYQDKSLKEKREDGPNGSEACKCKGESSQEVRCNY